MKTTIKSSPSSLRTTAAGLKTKLIASDAKLDISQDDLIEIPFDFGRDLGLQGTR